MASQTGSKSKSRIVLPFAICLLILTPVTVYFFWRTPRSHSTGTTKGLQYTPGPIVGLHCKNVSTVTKCPECPKNFTVTRLAPQSVHIDHSRCPLDQPFTVYVYKQDAFPVLHATDVTEIEEILKETNSWTDNPSKACLFICVIGPAPKNTADNVITDKVHSLPHWNDGVNHVLIDVPEVGHTSPTVTSFGSALIADEMDSTQAGLLTPPVPHSKEKIAPPLLYENSQSHILYFEGESTTQNSVLSSWLDSGTLSAVNFNMKFSCNPVTYSGFDGEWGLCNNRKQRLRDCADSRFSLVLGAPLVGSVTLTRLVEALQCGAVPVIAGVKKLPFDSVINWNRAAVLLPTLPPPRDLSTLLTSFQPETLMEYRRQGRLLHELYFSSRKSVLRTIVSIMRSKFMHPPPPAQDFAGNVYKVNDDQSKIQPSFKFLNKFAIYTESLWNDPPGPFYMYPVTPYRTPYVPAMFNKPADDSPGSFMPPILKGDMFRSSLHGIHPSEGFTVVALTYHRSQHLAEFVKGFQGCAFLAKIVIVWNDEKDPSKDFRLPNIGVPIEIVTTGRNSLNNRFLPLSNIETEAILAIDDDQKIPIGELQLGFRVWRENRDRIVGWYDRFVYWREEKRLWYYSWDVSCEPSLTLTGAAMYHKYYNYLYSYWMPQSIRDIVDKTMNGEDLAMNFLIAYVSRKPPMKIDSKVNLHGCTNCGSSISGHSNHLVHRSQCVNEFVKIWGHNTLLGTQFRTEPAMTGTDCLTNM